VRDERVREAAKILDLEPLLDRKPAKLSGGQRQRVAMGRAIVREPQVFLMDEPLSNLDAKLRVQTRTQIAALQRRLGVTTVYVTHDQVEAMTMGDRVAVLDRGLLQQVASPKDLFTTPVNIFVAGFIGSPSMNLLPAKAGDEGATHGTLTVPLTPDQRNALTSDAVTIGVRPEGWTIGADGGLEVIVAVVEELGSESFLYCTDPAANGAAVGTPVVARAEGLSSSSPGDQVSLVPVPGRLHLFDSATGARLPA
jgi:multiple sugar transport system ATP-binding protein